MPRLLPALLVLTLSSGGCAAAQNETPTEATLVRSVTVTGQGQATGAPDMAILRFSTRSRGDTAGAAMAANAEAMTAVRDRLVDLGVEARDMQTANLNLSPYYEQNKNRGFDPSRIAGYEAYNTLVVRLRTVDEAGAVIDAAVAAGANGLDGLSFAFQDEGALREAARKDAVADAATAATLLAEEAGATLGQVLTITEGAQQTGGPRPMMRMEMESVQAATPIEGGEQAVTAQVRVTFALR